MTGIAAIRAVVVADERVMEWCQSRSVIGLAA